MIAVPRSPSKALRLWPWNDGDGPADAQDDKDAYRSDYGMAQVFEADKPEVTEVRHLSFHDDLC